MNTPERGTIRSHFALRATMHPIAATSATRSWLFLPELSLVKESVIKMSELLKAVQRHKQKVPETKPN